MVSHRNIYFEIAGSIPVEDICASNCNIISDHVLDHVEQLACTRKQTFVLAMRWLWQSKCAGPVLKDINAVAGLDSAETVFGAAVPPLDRSFAKGSARRRRN